MRTTKRQRLLSKKFHEIDWKVEKNKRKKYEQMG